MSDVVASRVTGRIEGDFVVFLIGMRINKPWKLHKWLPAARAMPKMLRELEAAPPDGRLPRPHRPCQGDRAVLAQLRSSGALRARP